MPGVHQEEAISRGSETLRIDRPEQSIAVRAGHIVAAGLPSPPSAPCYVRAAAYQSFRSKRLDDNETKCINVCAEKFIKLTSRVALRFQDIQQQKAKDEAAGAQR